MPLVVSSVLRRDWALRPDVSSVCIYVDKKYLSQQYGLTLLANNWVHGSIVDVSKVYGPLSDAEREALEKHVIGKSVRLYLVPGILTAYDKLYFDKESWSVLRDAGVFPDEYKVKMKLLKVEIETAGKVVEEVNLYPYRDVEAPEA